jgi:hypothetical protein
MKALGEGVAFAAMAAGATCLEIYDKPAEGLWVFLVLWAICSNW